MKNFFKKYPNAQPLFKVGENYFLNHQEKAAKLCAAQTGEELEVVDATASKAPAKSAAKKVKTDGTTKG